MDEKLKSEKMQKTALLYIQLYSPECTLAENININNNECFESNQGRQA